MSMGLASEAATLRIAVVVSRFPKFTETFVVDEVLALRQLGVDVELFPLLPVEPEPHQPAAGPLVAGAHFGTPWGRDSASALLATARRRPGALLGTVLRLLLDTWRRPAFLLKDLALLPRVCAIARVVDEQRLDHVHAHFATHAGFAAWAIGRLTGLPYSIVAHGSDVHRHQAMLPTKVREAAFVATVSEYNRSVILARCGPAVTDRVHVVRQVVHLPADPADDVAGAGGVPTVSCVGTLHEVKGQRHVVEAVARLVVLGRRVRLDLVGDGPDLDDLRDLAARRGLGDRVRFLGALPHDAVIECYARSKVVVVPSVASSDGRREGLPTVIVEAMACGTPVVASDLSGIPELVEHEQTGLLVAPGDVEGLASAIERLLDDPELRARLRAAASARVEREFAPSATAGRIAELIRSARPRA